MAKASEPLVLTEAEYRAGESVLARMGLVRPLNGMERVLDAINAVRRADPVGTVRREFREGTWTDKYAFAFAPGEYILIDTNVDAPAYRTVEGDEAAAIQKDWPRA